MKWNFILSFLSIAFISVLISSCGENNIKESKDLCLTIVCGLGYTCDSADGICKKLDGYCLNNSQCKDSEFCDTETETCKIIEINTDCIKHQDCETWEVCDFSTKECITRENMCNQDRDCVNHPFLKCNTGTHKCEDPKDCYYTGCEFWEKCGAEGECNLIPGYCNENSDCDAKFPYTECNLDIHNCVAPINSCTSYTECNTWEICDTGLGICKPESGKCTSFLDCIDNDDGKTECDTQNNLCKTPEDMNCVNTGCSFYWRECNETTGGCDLPSGFCDDDNDCSGNGIETCDNQHKCVRDDCTVFGCSWWKTCDENSGICKPRPSMCASDSDCEGSDLFTICDTLIHVCKRPQNMECTGNGHCDSWQECNIATNRCELKPGYCLNDEQCGLEQNCNLNDHRCYQEQETCLNNSSICNYWEECDSTTRSCKVKYDFCASNNDCNENETCNYDIHKCEESISTGDCIEGETTDCYTASDSTMNIGECQTGTKTCTSELTWSDNCVGEITPVEEICEDSLDNNCNNIIDENCNLNSDSFMVYYSERDLSDGKEWKFKNLNTNTYITVVATGFSFNKYADMKQAIIYSFTYQSSPEYRSMVINKMDWTYTELTGTQIYDKMLLYLNSNQTYYLEDWYYWRSGVLAKTQNGKVYLNRKSYWDIAQYADTITHELMHIMGFSHGDNSSSGKADSVPYFIGYATEDYAELQ